MATNKIDRIDREIAKTREKLAEYQNKLRELEAQKTEAENLQIVQLVRAVRMTPQELNALLSGGGIPGVGTPAPDAQEKEGSNGIPHGPQERGEKVVEKGRCYSVKNDPQIGAHHFIDAAGYLEEMENGIDKNENQSV